MPLFLRDEKIPRLSLDDFLGSYGSNDITQLNEHFRSMVISENGTSFVNTEDDLYYSKMVQMMLVKVLGKKAAQFIKVSGSAAQNLKCVSANDQGDADIVFVSDFPKMTKKQQNMALIPSGDPGFFRIKRLRDWNYPYVKKDGVKYLSASSLRKFDSTWYPKELQLTLLVVESLEHEFKQAEEEKLASTLTWRSSTYDKFGSLQNGLIHEHNQYFYMLSRSYNKHIMPLLDSDAKQHAEEFIKTFMTIATISDLYGTSDSKKGYEALQKLSENFDNGIVFATLLNYRKMNELSRNYIDNGDVYGLIEASKYFEIVAKEEVEKRPALEDMQEESLIGAVDLVPSIACEGFPDIAKSWHVRVAGGHWPHPNVVSEVLKAGFHLVPKISKDSGSDTATTFRLSFNDAEEILALSVTQFQRECYRIFKMYYYEKMEREPKVVATYHLKTVFYWVLEETEEAIWREENRAFCCILLLKALASALKSMHLRHYFIPENNLFKYLHKEMAAEVSEGIEKIIADPVGESGPKINKIVSFYSKKVQGEAENSNTEQEVNTFFEKADKLFERAVKDIFNSHGSSNQNAKQALRNIVSDKTKRSILKFCFDLIFARHCQAQLHGLFSRYSPLPSPIATLVQVLLPAANEIVKKVFLPQLQDNARYKRRFKQIEGILKIASFLDYEDLLDIAQLKKLFSGSKDNKLQMIENAFKQLFDFHDEL